jgi:glycosyltransferase involved in cell wall biosynthesis
VSGRAEAAEAGPLDVVLVEFLPSGGMYQFTFQLAEALAEQGHRVRLLTGPRPELASRTPGLEVVEAFPTWHPNDDQPRPGRRRTLRRGLRALRLVESWRRTVAEVRRTRPDVVQFGELRYPLDSAGLLAVARLGRPGAVVDVAHNPLPYDVSGKTAAVEKTGRLTRRLLAAAYAACDLVLVLGPGPRDDLLRAFPAVSRTAVCGHGNYTSVLGRDEIVPPSAAPPRVLFFGAWTKYKDIPLMLDAFALVRARLPQARLTLAGPVMTDVDLAEVTAHAQRVGHVDLRPGYVDLADLPALFAAHRVVVFTYATVNISGSVHMAYTFGRPVVATDVGSMSDAVEHDVTGLLAPPDPAAVATALLAVLSDPGRADRLGASAARRAAQDASWGDVAERATRGYREALAGTTSAPASFARVRSSS